jgi:hypothetical protein
VYLQKSHLSQRLLLLDSSAEFAIEVDLVEVHAASLVVPRKDAQVTVQSQQQQQPPCVIVILASRWAESNTFGCAPQEISILKVIQSPALKGSCKKGILSSHSGSGSEMPVSKQGSGRDGIKKEKKKKLSTDKKNKQNVKESGKGVQVADDTKLKSVTELLHALVAEAVPKATKVAKYGGTLYTLKPEEKEGQFCGVFANKDNVHLIFSKGNQLSDPGGLLKGTGKFRRQLIFEDAADINLDVVKQFTIDASKLC